MRRILHKILTTARTGLAIAESPFDHHYLDPLVPMADHGVWQASLRDKYNRPGMRVLEIGSREVTGPSNARHDFRFAEYVGFDYFPGDNVDVVGDVHRLSSYFGDGERFDLIYSIACFEHFAMPWVVAMEISRMLKVGGDLLIATHFTYGSHERPWHFFQFSDMALRVLFNPALGFECLEAGASNPMVGRFARSAHPALRYKPVPGLYCGSAIWARKTHDPGAFSWETADIPTLVNGTEYPRSRPDP